MEKSDSCFVATEKCPLLFILLFSYIHFKLEKRFYHYMQLKKIFKHFNNIYQLLTVCYCSLH